MRHCALTIATLLLLSGCKTPSTAAPVAKRQVSTIQTLEVGCATCIFHMKNVKGCKLAVKIDGKPYLVTGSDIDDHGDAHAEDGLCNSSRVGQVKGRVEGNRFVAQHIGLVPAGMHRPKKP